MEEHCIYAGELEKTSREGNVTNGKILLEEVFYDGMKVAAEHIEESVAERIMDMQRAIMRQLTEELGEQALRTVSVEKTPYRESCEEETEQVDQIAKLDEKEKDNKNVLKKYDLRADTLKTIAKETEKDTKKLKSAAIPVSNIFGSEEYVKVKKSDWEKIIDAFGRAVSRNKLLEKYEKKIVALEKKVSDVSGLLDKMKQFISNRGLGEAFAEFVKSLEPKTMKERLTEKQKVVKKQTQQKSMHTQEYGTSRKDNISTEL